MPPITIQGVVYRILPQIQKGDNFTIQEIVISVTETYKNGKTKDHLIPIQFNNQRCDEIQKVAEGEQVEVKFNLSGNEWQGKFFPKLQGWTITSLGANGQSEAVRNEAQRQREMANGGNQQSAGQNYSVPPADDDLPF